MKRLDFVKRVARVAKHETSHDVNAAISIVTRSNKVACDWWLSFQDNCTSNQESRLIRDIKKQIAK